MTAAGCSFLLAAVVISTLLDGLALKTLWGWFIAPAFNVPELSLVVAIGIGLVVSLLTARRTTTNESGDEAAIQALIWTILKPLSYVGIGFIVYQFM
jgi:hypothetical protein